MTKLKWNKRRITKPQDWLVGRVRGGRSFKLVDFELGGAKRKTAEGLGNCRKSRKLVCRDVKQKSQGRTASNSYSQISHDQSQSVTTKINEPNKAT